MQNITFTPTGEIEGTRVIHGPPRSFSRSVHRYFLQNQNDKFHTNEIKEVLHMENYFDGWDGKKTFIDCNLRLFGRSAWDIKVYDDYRYNFTKDISIFNILPLESRIASKFIQRYYIQYIVKTGYELNVLNEEEIFMRAVSTYCIENYLKSIEAHGFKGDLIFVPSSRFNLNEIFSDYGIEHDFIELPHLNQVSARITRHAVKFMYFKKLHYWMNLYRDKIEEVKERNVAMIKDLNLYKAIDIDWYVKPYDWDIK